MTDRSCVLPPPSSVVPLPRRMANEGEFLVLTDQGECLKTFDFNDQDSLYHALEVFEEYKSKSATPESVHLSYRRLPM